MSVRMRTIRGILRDGTINERVVEVLPPAPPECAWCRSTVRVQRVGLDGWAVVMVCPDHLGLAFEESRWRMS